jgi:hypothetical protein
MYPIDRKCPEQEAGQGLGTGGSSEGAKEFQLGCLWATAVTITKATDWCIQTSCPWVLEGDQLQKSQGLAAHGCCGVCNRACAHMASQSLPSWPPLSLHPVKETL